VNDAFPHGVAFESFFYGHSLHKHGRSAVLVLDSLFQLIGIGIDVGHPAPEGAN